MRRKFFLSSRSCVGIALTLERWALTMLSCCRGLVSMVLYLYGIDGRHGGTDWEVST